MRILLISDNRDTATGLRLAGVEGKIVSGAQEVEKIIDGLSDDIGIVLISTHLYESCEDYIRQYMVKSPKLQIVEIPDRGEQGHANAIAKYVRDAIGISI